ncbi:hypothetical protein [Kribbella kalugense]|uniref:hypothetical protein n=1 Tax=Kribbella kalugense TaxID=2512221 RepID=UPI001066BBB6|nr:hypothetical protein [Kribbella kalugense]
MSAAWGRMHGVRQRVHRQAQVRRWAADTAYVSGCVRGRKYVSGQRIRSTSAGASAGLGTSVGGGRGVPQRVRLQRRYVGGAAGASYGGGPSDGLWLSPGCVIVLVGAA